MSQLSSQCTQKNVQTHQDLPGFTSAGPHLHRRLHCLLLSPYKFYMPLSLTFFLEHSRLVSACSRCCQYPAHISHVGLPATNFSHGKHPSHEQGGTEVPGSSPHPVTDRNYSTHTPALSLLRGMALVCALQRFPKCLGELPLQSPTMELA